MFNRPILCIPRSEAIRSAENYLSNAGYHITRSAAPDVAHVLLPVPSFPAGDEYLAHILSDLPDDVIISGGNLSTPLLSGYTTIDFLKDPFYLAENAALTASCAVKILEDKFTTPLNGKQVLIIGWGRIGKCLHRILALKGAHISVAVRKDSDRAMISALGSRGISITDAARESIHYDIIINTVPAMILPNLRSKETSIIMELASSPGISGRNILDCRGLPAKTAPKESGQLIAKTFLRLALEQEVSS